MGMNTEIIKITKFQSSQDVKYGDFYEKYMIETDENNKFTNEMTKEKVIEVMKVITGCSLDYSTYKKEENESFDNHFRHYYSLSKNGNTYLFTVTHPSTH